ncbi:unnamed protein product [Cunninghamella blakesleeana]
MFSFVRLKSIKVPLQSPQKTVGNDDKSSSLKGSKHTGLVKKFRKQLDISENNGELVRVEIDEFNTSKICINCGQKTLINKYSDNGPMVVNAALNIYNLARWQLEGKEQPKNLIRKGNELNGSDDENEDNEDSDDNDNDNNNNNDDHIMEDIDYLDFDGPNPPSTMNNNSNNNINNNYDQPFNQPPHYQPLPFNPSSYHHITNLNLLINLHIVSLFLLIIFTKTRISIHNLKYNHSNNHRLILQLKTKIQYSLPTNNNNKTKQTLFKSHEQKFDIVLVDMNHTNYENISCIKKNMYDTNLNYIAISYRWGECNEQLVKTPDYIAHVTSFDLKDFKSLCMFIKKRSDLKHIRYLWIDALSVDQQDQSSKKETILKMNQIYKRATYILAIPDLHLKYLWENPANMTFIQFMQKYSSLIYHDIINDYERSNHQVEMLDEDNEEINQAYLFLDYLISDWSNRAWVIKDHQYDFKFFTYSFHHHHQQKDMILKVEKNEDEDFTNKCYWKVYNTCLFIDSLKQKLTQRHHLDKLLNSKASKNEDRFYAILPSWNKYKYLIKNKNTISKWNITDMTSVILKLYEIMDDDLWHKARLLYACSKAYTTSQVLPSFANHYQDGYLFLKEIDFINNNSYYNNDSEEEDGEDNPENKIENDSEDDVSEINGITESIYTENLTNIRLNNRNHHDPYLTVKSKIYTIVDIEYQIDQDILLSYSLNSSHGNEREEEEEEKGDDDLQVVYIPFFTFTVSNYLYIDPKCGTGIYLLGNMDKNRWVVAYNNFGCPSLESYSYCFDNYTFNIY